MLFAHPSMRIQPMTEPSFGSMRAMHSVCQTMPHTSPLMYSISFSHRRLFEPSVIVT